MGTINESNHRVQLNLLCNAEWIKGGITQGSEILTLPVLKLLKAKKVTFEVWSQSGL